MLGTYEQKIRTKHSHRSKLFRRKKKIEERMLRNLTGARLRSQVPITDKWGRKVKCNCQKQRDAEVTQISPCRVHNYLDMRLR